MTLSPSAGALAVIVAGNTRVPVTAYFLLKATRFGNELDRLRDVLGLVFLGLVARRIRLLSRGSKVPGRLLEAVERARSRQESRKLSI